MRILSLVVLSSAFAGVLCAQKPKQPQKPKETPKAAKPKDANDEQAKQDPKDAAAAKKAEEMKAKGFVEVDGTWVEKDRVEDAKNGIFHFDGQTVTKGEYLAMQDGRVRHPITGELIPAAAVEEARGRKFPTSGDGAMADEKAADAFHSDASHPWILTRRDYVLVSTLPLAKLESLREHAERGLTRVRPVLGSIEPIPTARPTILVASSQDEFVQYGTSIGDGGSAYGGFLAREEAQMQLPHQGGVRPSVALWDDSWGPYYLPHAAGLAYVHSVCVTCGEIELPGWLLHGIASLGSRFESPATGAWFCQSMAKAGGFQALDSWFKDFKISGDMEPDAISRNLTQAGLVLDYCMQGGEAKATAALQALTQAFVDRNPVAVKKATKALQAALVESQPGIEKYLQKQLR